MFRRDRHAKSTRVPVLLFVLALAGGFTAADPACAQRLLIDPAVSVPLDFNFTLEVTAESEGLDVKGLESTILFNPALVRLDSITPGPWFTDSGQAFYFYDYASPGVGEIHFAAALLDGSQVADGSLAICHFSVLGFGIANLIFEDVDVRGPNNERHTFYHTIGDRIVIDPAVPVTLETFGALKAIYR